MKYQEIEIRTITDEIEGSLSFFEVERDIPFKIKRIYYIHGVKKDIIRGGHAHKALKQFIICIQICY